MNAKKLVYFRPKEAPSPIYTPAQNEQWYDTLLDCNRVMEILGNDQIQGAIATEVTQ